MWNSLSLWFLACGCPQGESSFNPSGSGLGPNDYPSSRRHLSTSLPFSILSSTLSTILSTTICLCLCLCLYFSSPNLGHLAPSRGKFTSRGRTFCVLSNCQSIVTRKLRRSQYSPRPQNATLLMLWAPRIAAPTHSIGPPLWQSSRSNLAVYALVVSQRIESQTPLLMPTLSQQRGSLRISQSVRPGQRVVAFTWYLQRLNPLTPLVGIHKVPRLYAPLLSFYNVIMARRLTTFITQVLEKNLSLKSKWLGAMFYPLAGTVTNTFESWRTSLIPKSNPYQMFHSLNQIALPFRPSEMKVFAKGLRSNANSTALKSIRESLRGTLNHTAHDLRELRLLRNEVYGSSWRHSKSETIKTLIEIDAKLYLYYKSHNLAKQMAQQLTLVLTSIRRLRINHPEDQEMASFKDHHVSSLYQQANLLKSLKKREDYILTLEELYKMQLGQEESPDKKRHCNRILRRICIHYLMDKDVESILRHYNQAESESERKIVRKYLVEAI